MSGTSMSAPHVAGLAALILQAHPNWNSGQVKNAIKLTTTSLSYDYNTQGAGMADAVKLFDRFPPYKATSRKISLYPTADSFVVKNKPRNNFGNLKYLQTDSSPDTRIYAKFNLKTLENKKIYRARLYVKVEVVSQDTQVLKKGSSNSWSESRINYNNKPSLVETISKFKARSRNRVVEIDITYLVQMERGKEITLGITSAGRNLAKYYSSEVSSASNRPKVVVEYE